MQRFWSRQLHTTARRWMETLPPLDRSRTHFQIFDLPVTFRIPARDLKRRFLELQRKVHPDSFAQAGEEQAARARMWSEQVNRAYKVLDSPLDRAEYLLSLNNAEILESDSVQDPELLMLMMEAHEALEEAQDESQVEALRQANRKHLQSVVQELEAAFDQKDYEAAKHLTIKLRYYTNIENACKDWTEGKPIVLQH